MLNRSWLGIVGGLLIVAVLIALWVLRPGVEIASQPVAMLQVESQCDSAQRACVARGKDLELEFRLEPPVRPLESFEIALRSVRGSLGANAQVAVQFQMRDMEMGINRYRLVAGSDGVWRGRAILPVCSTGRSDWVAQLDIVDAGRRWKTELPFTAVSPRL